MIAPTRTGKPRGKCRYCGRLLALRANGTIRRHVIRHNAAGAICGGSGGRPA
jgi:hypothetical protein